MLKRASAGLMLGTSLGMAAGMFAAMPALAQDQAPQAAEQAADEAPVSSDDIVVTARRRSEKLIDVPAAISVVSMEQMQAKGIQSPTDLIHSVPSLQQSGSGFGSSTPHFVIRGQRQQLQFIQSDQSVGVYIDEITVPRQQGLNAGLFDMASIQVLKGPQGTLFGKNHTAGAILFTSQTPKAEFGGYFSATIGKYDARKIEGAINVPVTESLQLRFAGQINRRDGYIRNVTDGRDYNDIHTDGWRVSAHFAPAELPLENWLIVSGSRQKEIGAIAKQLPQYLGLPGVGTSGIYAAFGNANGFDAINAAAINAQARSYGKWEAGGIGQFQLPDGTNVDITNFSVSNKTEFGLSDNMTLRNIFGYRFVRSYQSSSVGVAGYLLKPGTTGTNASAASLFVPIPDPINAPNTPAPAGNIVCGPQSGVDCIVGGNWGLLNYTKQRQVSNELSILGNAFDGTLDYILGAYYFREYGDGVTSNYVPLSTPGGRRLAQNQPANQSHAIFGQVTWKPIPTVSVTGGLRNTWDRRETNSRTATPLMLVKDWRGLILADGVNATCALTNDSGALPNTPDGCLISAKTNFKKLTYTASIDWKPFPDTLLYVVTRKGYRSGGFNQSTTADTTATGFSVTTPFRPETVTDYEIGFKGNWRWDNGMAAGLNVAAYRNKYADIQRAVSTIAGNRSVTINAADAVIKGLEIEARFEPTPWLELTGYYSLIDATFNRFDIPATGVYRDAGSYAGAKFSGVPTDSGGATITLHTELPNGMGRVAASMDYYGQTGTWLQDNNFNAITKTFILADYMAGYWLLGANLSWTNVMGKPVDLGFNIRNINNKQYLTAGVDGSTSGIGTVTHFIGEPQMYTVSLKYRF